MMIAGLATVGKEEIDVEESELEGCISDLRDEGSFTFGL